MQLYLVVVTLEMVWPSLVIPMAIIKQNPMLGMYRTRSATTKPTGKNRFVAGRKGNRIRVSARITVCNLRQTPVNEKKQ